MLIKLTGANPFASEAQSAVVVDMDRIAMMFSAITQCRPIGAADNDDTSVQNVPCTRICLDTSTGTYQASVRETVNEVLEIIAIAHAKAVYFR